MDYRSMAKKAGYVTGGFLGALALFLPSTPKHKSIDAEVMKNLKAGNAQTQQVAHSQPTLDEYIGASPGHTAEEAYAGGSPRDKKLRQQMSQPVVDTLEGANYTVVNDQNYDQEVYNADRPVMTLFYSDNKQADGNNPSRGLAVVANLLENEFSDEIKLCVYQVDDTTGIVPEEKRNNLAEEGYNVEKVPALLNYKMKPSGKIVYDDGLQGGLTTLDGIKKNYRMGCKYIEANILK